MLKKLLLVPLAIVLAVGVAAAEDVHDHDPKHGGVVVHSGHHHLELVAAGASIELFVTDVAGEPEDVAAARASATVLADGKTEQVALAPSGANRLKGVRSTSEGKIAAVIVSLTLPGHEAEQVRFQLD